VHVWLGRVVLPVSIANTVLGLLLRHYGWLTISLTVALAAVELIVLTLVVGRARSRRPGGTQKGPLAPTAEEAEEYFQLEGDDEDEEVDDAFDDDHDVEGGGASNLVKKQQEKEDQQKRLAKLDKV